MVAGSTNSYCIIEYPSSFIGTQPRYDDKMEPVTIGHLDDPLANDVAQHWKDNEKEAISTGKLFFYWDKI